MKETTAIREIKTNNTEKRYIAREFASTCVCVIGLAAVLLLGLNGLGWLAETVGAHMSVLAGVFLVIALGSVHICLEIPVKDNTRRAEEQRVRMRPASSDRVLRRQDKMPANTGAVRHLRAS